MSLAGLALSPLSPLSQRQLPRQDVEEWYTLVIGIHWEYYILWQSTLWKRLHVTVSADGFLLYILALFQAHFTGHRVFVHHDVSKGRVGLLNMYSVVDLWQPRTLPLVEKKMHTNWHRYRCVLVALYITIIFVCGCVSFLYSIDIKWYKSIQLTVALVVSSIDILPMCLDTPWHIAHLCWVVTSASKGAQDQYLFLFTQGNDSHILYGTVSCLFFSKSDMPTDPYVQITSLTTCDSKPGPLENSFPSFLHNLWTQEPRSLREVTSYICRSRVKSSGWGSVSWTVVGRSQESGWNQPPGVPSGPKWI